MNKLVIAKSGKNALTDTNPDDLIFSSDYNTLKYYLNDSTLINIIGNNTDLITTTNITHGLGYVPFFIVYVNIFTNATLDGAFSIVPHESSTIARKVRAEAWADSTKIYFQLRNNSLHDYTAVFNYKIFKNSLNL